MATQDPTADCFVCIKHREQGPLMPGGPIAEDNLTVVSHLTPNSPKGDGGPVYLGHLFVEPRRHAPGLADLTEAEAERVGVWCMRASRALLEVAGAEHVYSAVVGDDVPHLHVHLLPRYPGTPREYRWNHVDEWPQADRGDLAAIEVLVSRLRDYVVTIRPDHGG